ncbi:VirB4 family type IV secretion/conjugal transfer ATPase [Duganella levis]|uniref:VirB4 family type IV secretion/conjugal transfer ATPase n=1 Tax=Duganella levis TaxID=2692169 RepID=A0ABW9VT43_9BURK|nr:VirB4 family type IV secretion/conjugal transfer ATPase [Duganella levis]MYN24798.1 VirB4 family type IV secretion/conjugal transfer ATPase [Duganella levis]
MRALTALRRRAHAEAAIADHVPFGGWISPEVIRLRHNGDLLATWRIAGIAFETADPAFIADRKRTLHNFWNAMGGGRCAIWAHKVRRAVNLVPGGIPEQAFARHFTQRYHASLTSNRTAPGPRQMVTELYLSLLYRPLNWPRAGLRKRLAGASLAELLAAQQSNLAAIDEMGQRLENSLRSYGPERLGEYRHAGHAYSEQAAFYGFLLNGVWEEVACHDTRLADYLPVSRLHFGDSNGMLEIWHPEQRRFAGLLDFQDYPSTSQPGMNNAILYSDYEYIETQSFSMLGKRDALHVLDRQRGHLYAAQDPSTREIEEIDAAMGEVNSGDIQMGEYHYSLAVFGDTPAQTARHMAHARTALQDGPGFKMAIVDAIPECAWFAQLPGNWRMRPREAAITSKNFTNLAPLHNFAQGKRDGNPWGPALALMDTPSGQPYFLNHHASPVDQDSTDDKRPGNTIVIGPTGVGKTALVNGLMTLAQKYAGYHAMFFDKERGAEICIRRLDGHYTGFKRGEPTGLNPFQLPLTERNIAYAEQWLRLLAGPAQPGDATQEESESSHAVRTVMSDAIPFELRRLSTVWQNLTVRQGGRSLRDRLHKWTAQGPLGWAFDNPRHTHALDLQGVSIYGYDCTEILDDAQLCSPIVDLLLHMSTDMIDGNPFVYYMEEFWKYLENDQFADSVYNRQKTIRKLNGLGVFITQSPADTLLHRISKTIVEQCVTKIFLPNPAADHDDYVLGFKLSEQEFNLIRNMNENSRLLLVKQNHQSAILKYDLSDMPDILNIFSGSLDNVLLLDEIRAKVGDAPEAWEPVLQQRIRQRRQKLAHKEHSS